MDIDQSHIDAFFASTKELFNFMIGIPVEMEVINPGVFDDKYDLSGTIEITGDIAGTVTVGFENNVASLVVEQMFGAPLRIGSEDFADAIGELTNIIVGSAKSKLQDMTAAIGCPTVLFESGYGSELPNPSQRTCIRCKISEGVFYINIILQSTDFSTV